MRFRPRLSQRQCESRAISPVEPLQYPIGAFFIWRRAEGSLATALDPLVQVMMIVAVTRRIRLGLRWLSGSQFRRRCRWSNGDGRRGSGVHGETMLIDQLASPESRQKQQAKADYHRPG